MAKETAPTETAAAAAAALEASTEAAPKVRRKKTKLKVPLAYACIFASENNTLVTFTDLNGNKIAGCSCGAAGFKGARKSTPYAAKVTAEQAAAKALPYGVEKLHVRVKGIGPGREQAIRGLQSAGLNLESIVDVTPIAHGGCRPRRRRRV